MASANIFSARLPEVAPLADLRHRREVAHRARAVARRARALGDWVAELVREATAQARNRRFVLLSALCTHTKRPYKNDLKRRS